MTPGPDRPDGDRNDGTVARMRIQVLGADGSSVTLALATTGWHTVVERECGYLIGDGVAHVFTRDGYYAGTRPVPTLRASPEPTG